MTALEITLRGAQVLKPEGLSICDPASSMSMATGSNGIWPPGAER